jgi:hypothetical protein
MPGQPGQPGQTPQKGTPPGAEKPKPKAKPEEEKKPKKPGFAKAEKARRRTHRPDITVQKRLDSTLDLIVKGLVEVDVFNETATGQDLYDILPDNLLAEITNQLSALESAE